MTDMREQIQNVLDRWGRGKLDGVEAIDRILAVIAQALLSEASVEAAAETMFNESQDYPAWDDLSDEWGSDYGLGKNFYRSASRTQLRAALTAIGAVTEEGGEE